MRDLALAVNTAQAEKPAEAIAQAFPDPEPLTGGQPDDDWDRAPIWSN